MDRQSEVSDVVWLPHDASQNSPLPPDSLFSSCASTKWHHEHQVRHMDVGCADPAGRRTKTRKKKKKTRKPYLLLYVLRFYLPFFFLKSGGEERKDFTTVIGRVRVSSHSLLFIFLFLFSLFFSVSSSCCVLLEYLNLCFCFCFSFSFVAFPPQYL